MDDSTYIEQVEVLLKRYGLRRKKDLTVEMATAINIGVQELVEKRKGTAFSQKQKDRLLAEVMEKLSFQVFYMIQIEDPDAFLEKHATQSWTGTFSKLVVESVLIGFTSMPWNEKEYFKSVEYRGPLLVNMMEELEYPPYQEVYELLEKGLTREQKMRKLFNREEKLALLNNEYLKLIKKTRSFVEHSEVIQAFITDLETVINNWIK